MIILSPPIFTLLPMVIDLEDHIHAELIPTLFPILIVAPLYALIHARILRERGLIFNPLEIVKLLPIMICEPLPISINILPLIQAFFPIIIPAKRNLIGFQILERKIAIFTGSRKIK